MMDMIFKQHTDFAAIDALAPTWNDLLAASVTNSPFLRFEYMQAWWQMLGGGEWDSGQLAIFTAERDGNLTGIAPLFQTTNRDGDTALMLLGSIEISDYLDLVARPDDLPTFVNGLLDQLASDSAPAWSVLDWYNLPEESPTLPLLKAAAERRGWTFSQERLQPAPYIKLPGDFDEYLANIDKKQRHEVRRKMRRADEYEKPVRWYFVEDEDSLDAELDGFLNLMAQDPAKAEFLTSVMRSQMHVAVHAAFKAGWLQLSFLEVDGKKACGYLNFDYDNRIWVYNSGLDRRFLDISAGWVLLAHLLQWANEQGRSEFDFMRGDEEYKYRFGAVDRYVARVKISR
jgi:CelD/BcsL family acetyltransferase involved in cellulose biosynthesis